MKKKGEFLWRKRVVVDRVDVSVKNAYLRKRVPLSAQHPQRLLGKRAGRTMRGGCV